MAHHKRRKRKNARSGCLMCKPHKANGAKDKEKASVKRRTQEEREKKDSFEKLPTFYIDEIA